MTGIIAPSALLHDGRYLVGERLSEGGMGAIYLADDRVMHRQVAIKVARLVTPQARDQFRREAAYLKKLQHHGLPRVWDYFGDTQRDFLVMEYIPGEDLQATVSREGPQPEWLVLRWADELLDALDFLHTQTPPIIHRDVKPSNLKVRQNDELVLVDFGIAKEFVEGQATMTGAAAISPGYSPLEQYKAGGQTDARSDIYSAGATLYFFLTGRIPPEAPDLVSEDVLLTPKDLVPGLSAETNALVLHALELKRDDRWPSAADMRQEVNAALRRLHGGAAVVSPTRPDPAPAAPLPGPPATDPEQTRLQPPVPAKQLAEDVLVVRPHPVPASTGERLRPTYLSPRPTLPAQPDRPGRRRATVLVAALLGLVGLAAAILLLTRLAGGADPQPASPSAPVAELSAARTDSTVTPAVPTATPDVPTATPLAPTPVLTEPAPPMDTPPPTVRDYVIQPGDSLFSIALAFDTDVETLRRLNNLTDDVDTIFVGQALTVPNTGPIPALSATRPLAGRVVTVQAGDTLTGIAELFGVPWQDIVAANAIPGPNYRIYRGQTLVIPNITTQPPLPTATPTRPLPTSAPTRPLPTSTPTRPRPTATATPTRTRPKPTATPIALAVTLIRPGPDAVGTGNQTFAWEITAGSLAANRVFELIFWKEGQDPLSDGFGLAAPTTDTQIQVNLDDLDRQEGYPLAPGPYLWGLRLLATPDGRRVGMVGQPQRFFFQETGQTGEQPSQPPPGASPEPSPRPSPVTTPPVSLGLPMPDSTTAANLLANSSALGLAGVFGLLLLGRWDERRKR